MIRETIDMPCPRCSSTKLDQSLSGHLQEILCSSCGWSQFATIYPGDEVVEICDVERVRVIIEWSSGRANANELKVARRLFDRLAKMPLGVLAKSVRDTRRVDVGVFPRPIAERLLEQAAADGLTLILSDATTS